MKFIPTGIPDVILIEMDVFEDEEWCMWYDEKSGEDIDGWMRERNL